VKEGSAPDEHAALARGREQLVAVDGLGEATQLNSPPERAREARPVGEVDPGSPRPSPADLAQIRRTNAREVLVLGPFGDEW